MIIQSDFKAAWWLANPHLQTMWPTFIRRQENIILHRERVELPDGDFVDLDWTEPNGLSVNAPIVLILHGLGGSIDSPYAKSILKHIDNQGWRGVFMHFRGASGTPNRMPRSYHSGETIDVQYVANLILNRENPSKMLAVGYSLGGNVLLKWLGETKKENPLHGAIAISVPFELRKAADRLNTGFSRCYQWYLINQLRELLLAKFKVVKPPIDINCLANVRNFWEFDAQITAPLHGFKDADDYYLQSSSRPYLKDIVVPTIILHAKDDPFMSPECIPLETELSKYITLELSEQGGHVGFISGSIPGKHEYWLEKRIVEYIKKLF